MPLVLRLGCYIVDRDKNHFVVHSEIPNEPIQEANTASTVHDSPDRSSQLRSSAFTMFATSLSLKPNTQPRDAIRYVAHTVVQRRLHTSLYLPPLTALNTMAQREITWEQEMAAGPIEAGHEPSRSPRKIVHIVPRSPTPTGADFSSVNHSNTMSPSMRWADSPSRGLFTNSINDVGRSGHLTQGADSVSLVDNSATTAAAAAAAHAPPAKSPRHRRISFRERFKLTKKTAPAAPSSSCAGAGAVFTKDNAKSKDLCLCIADCDGVFHYCGSLQKMAPRSGADEVRASNRSKHPTIVKMPFVADACCHSHEQFMRHRHAARKLLLTDSLDSPSADLHHGGAQVGHSRTAGAGAGASPRDSFTQAQRDDTAAAAAATETARRSTREAEDEKLLAPLRLSFNNSLFNSEETGLSTAVDVKFAFLVGVVVPLTLLRALNPLETVCVSAVGSKEPPSDHTLKKGASSSVQGGGAASVSSATTKLYKKISPRRRFKLFEEVKVPKELSDFAFILESSNAPMLRQPTADAAHESRSKEESSQELDVPVDAGGHAQKGEEESAAAAAVGTPPPRETTEKMTAPHTATATIAGASHAHARGNSTMPPSNDTGSAVATLQWRSPVGDPSSYICAEDGATNVHMINEMRAEEDHVRTELAAAILAYEKVKLLFDTTAFAFGVPDASPDHSLVGQDPEVYQLMREKIELTTRLSLHQQHADQQISSDGRILEMQLLHLQDEINESRVRQEKLGVIAIASGSHVY